MQADGHCLYRAVGEQLGSGKANDYWAVRTKAAAYMRAHPDQFLPFLPEACSAALPYSACYSHLFSCPDDCGGAEECTREIQPGVSQASFAL